MDDPFVWRSLFKTLVLPPAAPLIVAVVGLALLNRHRRAGRMLVTVGVVALFVVSMPAVAIKLIRYIDSTPPLTAQRAESAQAIVILGGGTRRAAPEYGGDTLNRLTLERVRYGARVARMTGLPVMVVGGRAGPWVRDTEANTMRDALQNEFGVAVRWTEEQSRNTHENATMAAAILSAQGIHRVVLVVHTFDVPRVVAEFSAAGIETIPAPTGVPAPTSDWTLLDYVPTADGLQWSYYALYEIYANAARRWVGWK